MSNDDKDKKKTEDIIREKELIKVDAEIARIKEERLKIELERKELERKSHLHWFKKPLFIQAIIAGIIAVPLIWFYVKDVALPLSSRENIRLSREIEERNQQLDQERKNLEEMKLEHEIKVRGYIEDLKVLKKDYDKVDSFREDLVKQYEELSKDHEEYKNKYTAVLKNLEKQKGKIEKKRSVISESIFEQASRLGALLNLDLYLDREKAGLDKKGRPLKYTDNEYELQSDGKVVYDKATGLMWQQSGDYIYMVLIEVAKNYITQLNSKNFAGYNNWRLPTLEEAKSLLEPKRNETNNLYIDPIFNKMQERIWTSDLYSFLSYWFVNFDDGFCSDYMGYRSSIRAVR